MEEALRVKASDVWTPDELAVRKEGRDAFGSKLDNGVVRSQGGSEWQPRTTAGRASGEQWQGSAVADARGDQPGGLRPLQAAVASTA